MRVKQPAISEAHIQETCSQMLALDGWRRVRTDMKQLRGMGVQEPGMADDLFIRYCESHLRDFQTDLPAFPMDRRHAEAMWIEWKKKGGHAGDHQLDWHRQERKLGALTLIAGEDFPASIEGFVEWYGKSGLMRRKMTVGGKVLG